MKEKIILPIDFSPIVCCYHNTAFPLSVIQGNSKQQGKDIMPWAVGKYLNSRFTDSSENNKYEICMFDNWGLEDEIFRHQYINMYTDFYLKMNINIIACMIVALQEKCYISGQYNERYIPGKIAYDKYDFVHDYLIYGYDNIKQVFYSVGYTYNQIYEAFEIPYENFNKSVVDSTHNRIEFDLWRYNPECEFVLDLKRLSTNIEDYVNSTSSYCHDADCFYGIKSNERLQNYLVKSVLNGSMLDIRYTRAFMEQKYFLWKCIELLNNYSIIKLNDDEIKVSETI